MNTNTFNYKKILLISTIVMSTFLSCKKASNTNNPPSNDPLVNPPIMSSRTYPCPTCQNFPCVYDDMNTERVANNQTPLPLDEAYDFGDFLYYSEIQKREDYITYYYELSDYAVNNNLITASNLSDWYNFLSLGKTCAERLLNGSGTSIVITNEDYDAFMGFYNAHAAGFNDTSLQDMIEALVDDLEYAKGKTKTEVMAMFN